jgi:hypothetical protein
MDNLDRLKILDEWLCKKVNDLNIPQEERIIYSKVLDKIEELYLEE